MEIQITVSREELQAAPEVVHQWLLGIESKLKPSKESKPKVARDPLVHKSPDKPAKPDKPKPAKPDKPAKPEVEERVVLEQAARLIQAKGEDVLAGILSKLGLKRVREASEEKLSELQALVVEALGE